ncbi:HK97 family phage prohead protease [Dongia sp.]|uniref:HK97 family phage prohead protease n=1 Tax=Dongia sp. TaxID=1977262 RepID=UPI0035AF6506
MAGPEMERRAITEMRAAGRRLTGYAARFHAEARIANFIEVIKPGAFADTLRSNGDILALVDHDTSKVLGRTRSGTLKLIEDARGLEFDLSLPDTQLGRDMLALAERGDLGGMSFGFRVPAGGETWEGKAKRTLTRVDLAEISVVQAWPAYDATTVQARTKATINRAAYMRMVTESFR